MPDHPTADAPADPVEAVRQLAGSYPDLPVAAMRWALDNWAVAGPRFLAMLRARADGGPADEAQDEALYFAIHLLAEQRETAACQPLCRLLLDAERTGEVFGDDVDLTLMGVLIACFDGDPGPLVRLVEAVETDGSVRGAALDALGYHTRAGGFDDAAMRALLRRCYEELPPRGPGILWLSWVTAVGLLGYRDLLDEVRQLIDDGWVPEGMLDYEDVEADVQAAEADPTGLEVFYRAAVRPFEDSIATFTTWQRSAGDPIDDEFYDDGLLDASNGGLRLPYVNPLRDVGRNDPCPCGSGRKYKKCCLP